MNTKNGNYAKAILLLFLSVGNQNSAMGCELIVNGLVAKMAGYRSLRTENQKMQERLLGSEADCLRAGSEQSNRIAAAAGNLSCENQSDAREVNGSMENLGSRCEKVFEEINKKQNDLRDAFNFAKSDLMDALQSMKTLPYVADRCGNEINTASTMAAAFLNLEEGIALTQRRSLAAKVDYGNFTQQSATLKAATEALASNCGSHKSIGAPVAATTGAGAGQATFSGSNRNSVSDISGTKKAISDEARAQSVIQKP